MTTAPTTAPATDWVQLTSTDAHHIQSRCIMHAQAGCGTPDTHALLRAFYGDTGTTGQRTVRRVWIADQRAVLIHPQHLPAMARVLRTNQR